MYKLFVIKNSLNSCRLKHFLQQPLNIDSNRHSKSIVIRKFTGKVDKATEFLQDEKWKKTFAEGYAVGRMVTEKKPIFWKIVASFVSGLFVGGFLAFSITNLEIRDLAIDTTQIPTTFADVKGAAEAKQELMDIVQYLKRPERFAAIGGKFPKGVLLVGPPGTGKTLLARALAGEAGVPYFQISGSEFESMFVGEGARRVRELFTAAKRQSPCVVFIDEIDAVGAKRIHTPLNPHAHQTINQLLTEMDGFRRNDGVIVVGATNRRDDLDEALLRPGRFDVEVAVSTPTYAERKQIIEHYLNHIATDISNVDDLARGTIGFTGAHIESMINRAALQATLEGEMLVSIHRVFAERDRIIMGTELKSRIPDEKSKRITAYHEAGHCVVTAFTKNSQPIHKVSIVPRGESLGHTAYMPLEDQVYITKSELLARIDSLLAGRAAEELIFGPEMVTSGSESDLRAATTLARNMISKWGMSTKIGLRYGQENGPAYQDFVDGEVNGILTESYGRCKKLLAKYARVHCKLAEALLKYEQLDAKDVYEILNRS